MADIAPNAATGPVDFDVRAEVPGDPAGPDEADSVSFRISDQAPSRPRLALTLRPESESVAGHRTTFQAQLINVAGATARRAKIARVIEQRVGSTINARGTHWDCTPSARSTCRYNHPLDVGQAAPPLTVTAKLRRTLPAKQLPTEGSTSAKYGDVRWQTLVTTAGPHPSREVQSHSGLTRLSEPRIPRADRSGGVPDWTTQSHLEASVHSLTAIRSGGTGRLEVAARHNGVCRRPRETARRRP